MPDWNKGKPPANGTCWIVTSEGDVVEVGFYDEAYYWTGQPVWARQDGEVGAYSPDEIHGWSAYQEVAEDHAKAFLETGQ